MPDVVVTVPKQLWQTWLAEGDLAPPSPFGTSQDPRDQHPRLSGPEYAYSGRGHAPRISPGERVYIVAHTKLRGYAPLVRIEPPYAYLRAGPWALIRRGGAVAITLPCTHSAAFAFPGKRSDEQCSAYPDCSPYSPHTANIPGFRGYRYRWWRREDEVRWEDLVGDDGNLGLDWRQP